MIYIEKTDLDNWEFLCHNHKQREKYILQRKNIFYNSKLPETRHCKCEKLG